MGIYCCMGIDAASACMGICCCIIIGGAAIFFFIILGALCYAPCLGELDRERDLDELELELASAAPRIGPLIILLGACCICIGIAFICIGMAFICII